MAGYFLESVLVFTIQETISDQLGRMLPVRTNHALSCYLLM